MQEEKPIRERDIERYLLRRVREAFGKAALCRKVTWQGRCSAPDRVVMLPYTGMAARSQCNTVWVELKAPGETPNRAQQMEHARMALAGQVVCTLDSLEAVDAFIRRFGGAA